MVFCGAAGFSFAGVPFGFGLFAVEDSAGDDASMGVKESVEEGDGGCRDKGGWVGRSLSLGNLTFQRANEEQ